MNHQAWQEPLGRVVQGLLSIKSAAVRSLSYAVIATAALSILWGGVTYFYCAFFELPAGGHFSSQLKAVLLSILVVALVCSPYFARHARASTAKTGDAPRRFYSTGITTLKAICMIFVAVIHVGCHDVSAKYFVYRHLINQAVPMMFVAMGVTGLAASKRYSLVDRFAGLLEAWYFYIVFNWAYRYFDGNSTDWRGKYTTEEHAKILLTSVLGWCPCLGGAWFVFPMLQILLIIHVVNNYFGENKEWLIGFLTPIMIVFSCMPREVMSKYIYDMTDKWTNNLAMGCDIYSSVYTLMLWCRWVGYALAGMWFATFHRHIKRWQWSVALFLGSLACSVAMDSVMNSSMERKPKHGLAEFFNYASVITLTLASIIFFDHFQWFKAISWMGDCSWTFYLGQISILNVVGDSCGMAAKFVEYSPTITFVQLTFGLSWGFTWLMNGKKMRAKPSRSSADAGQGGIEQAPLLQLSTSRGAPPQKRVEL
ncbi:hypothetical protein HOP50_02g17340 [Chloropicon primus]|uniref:Uncharacterized protein n=1 Tax=Chloropicon primus TaxID=1764295 RepID=A0A5B8MFP3_9CHLO|nr:hypothetical protein A3770_02p17370 [Chloropicon primus]UPQ98428.1 hypothetical protein HOP50_02g17340 [Chloropicon primus]|eukprot:QDZ19219.1 hypothetical protein A3770_02p17370 [Chloropicon primus]